VSAREEVPVALEESLLGELMDALGRVEGETESTVTSVRLPVALRQALGVALELGLDASFNEATTKALRERVEVFAQRRALDAHYQAHPQVRPSLVELAQAAAELDGDSLAEEPALLGRAAAELSQTHPAATADDVLIYASALRAHRLHA
jgi:hypothetical protein